MVSGNDIDSLSGIYSEISKVFPFPGYMRGKLRKYASVASLITSELSHGKRILDIGCGPCDLTAILSKLGYKMTGVDDLTDPWHLIGRNRERIRRFARNLGIDLAVQSLWSFRRRDPFDAVMLLDVLEHVTRPRELLNRAISFVRPGGFVLIETPNSVALGKRIRMLAGKSVWPRFDIAFFNVGDYRTHIREYTIDELTRLLWLSGLTKIRFRAESLSTEEMLLEAGGVKKSFIRIYNSISALRTSFRDTVLIQGTRPRHWSPIEDFWSFSNFKRYDANLLRYNLDKETDRAIVSKLRKIRGKPEL